MCILLRLATMLPVLENFSLPPHTDAKILNIATAWPPVLGLTVDPAKKKSGPSPHPSPPFQRTACSSHLPRSSGLNFLCFRHRGTNMPRCQDFLKLGTGHSVKHRCLNALSPSLAPTKAHIVASLSDPISITQLSS